MPDSENPNTGCPPVSKRRSAGYLLLGLTVILLNACTTAEDADVRRLRARAAYDLATNELRDGRISVGLASLQEAVGLNPEEPLYFNTLGIVQLQLMDLPKATEAFKKAIQLDPDYAEAHHNLGVTLAEEGKWKEALQAYQKAVSIPIYARPGAVYTNMGWAYYNLGQLPEAEKALLQALRLQPTLQPASYNLGLVLLKAGRQEEAKAAFRHARDLAPETDFGLAAREHLKALGETR